jgi:endo-1,4-beta-xylanase
MTVPTSSASAASPLPGIDRRALLKGASLAAAGAALRGVAGPAAAAEPGLGAVAAGRGLFYGAAVDSKLLDADRRYIDLIRDQCGLVLSEWDMQWRFLEPAEGNPDFTLPERIAELAASSGKLLRGHALVWGELAPPWFTADRGAAWARRTIEKHVADVAGRFKGRMQSWDVVNEALAFMPSHPADFRGNAFTAALGLDYIEIAFRAARQADPGALLVYNENNVEVADRASLVKREALLKLVSGLKSAGVPTDAVGIQSHLDAPLSNFDEKGFAGFLGALAALGLKIIVTELDVNDRRLPTDFAARDTGVADAVSRYLAVVLDQPAVAGVVTWGITDRYSWIVREQVPKIHHRADGLPQRPLPYDIVLKPKPAVEALRRALLTAPPRSPLALRLP